MGNGGLPLLFGLGGGLRGLLLVLQRLDLVIQSAVAFVQRGAFTLAQCACVAQQVVQLVLQALTFLGNGGLSFFLRLDKFSKLRPQFDQHGAGTFSCVGGLVLGFYQLAVFIEGLWQRDPSD